MRGLALASATVLLGGVLLCGQALAADDPARESGDWRLSEVGGHVACTLTLTHQTSFAGFALKAPLACRRAFPALKSVAAWALDDKGGIVLSDANAQPIVTFPAPAAKAPYEARAPDGRTWQLVPLRPDQPIVTAPPGG
ncbi:MAG TPA: AprI/Inh family metalloprotease inhibitor [Caulobacteraceae bacterium]|jgi:hypothetical protein|nr:AprI/Inh family metalloprotease inhibitor [Caulobacteraceae bacterium]